MLFRTFPALNQADVLTTEERQNGPDLILSRVARTMIGDWAIEIKHRERLDIWSGLTQSQYHGDRMNADATKSSAERCRPLLVFRRARTPMYVALCADDFVSLLRAASVGRLARP